eukprot:scaffold4886_cov123-Isochrysis_galbana.AAC.11
MPNTPPHTGQREVGTGTWSERKERGRSWVGVRLMGIVGHLVPTPGLYRKHALLWRLATRCTPPRTAPHTPCPIHAHAHTTHGTTHTSYATASHLHVAMPGGSSPSPPALSSVPPALGSASPGKLSSSASPLVWARPAASAASAASSASPSIPPFTLGGS